MELAESLVARPSIAKNIRAPRFQADRVLRIHQYRSWDQCRKTEVKQMAIMQGRLPRPEAMIQRSNMNRQSRRELLDAKRAVALERDRHIKDEVKLAYEHFLKLVEDQDKLMREERAQICIGRILQACPKLTSVSVTMGNEEDLLPPISWQSVAAFKEALVGPWRDHLSIRINTRPMNEILTATLHTHRELKSLTIAPVDHHFFAQEEAQMSTIYSAISNLETLRIRIDHNWHQSKDDSATWCAIERMLVQDGLKPESDRQCACSGSDDDDEKFHDDRETDEDAARRVMRSYKDGRLARFLSHTPKLQELHFEGRCRMVMSSP